MAGRHSTRPSKHNRYCYGRIDLKKVIFSFARAAKQLTFLLLCVSSGWLPGWPAGEAAVSVQRDVDARIYYVTVVIQLHLRDIAATTFGTVLKGFSRPNRLVVALFSQHRPPSRLASDRRRSAAPSAPPLHVLRMRGPPSPGAVAFGRRDSSQFAVDDRSWQTTSPRPEISRDPPNDGSATRRDETTTRHSVLPSASSAFE